MMEDEADLHSNLCTDLVSMKRYESGVAHLLAERPAGVWVPVRELCRHAGAPEPDTDDLMAAWLPSPNNLDYAVILFLNDETKWSQTADYNATRLLGRRLASPVAVAG